MASLLVWLVSSLVCVAPLVAARRRDLAGVATTIALVALVGAAVTTDRATIAYAILAGTAALHAGSAWPRTRTGAAFLVLGATTTAIAGFATSPRVVFIASAFAIALRGGVMPLHLGVAALANRSPRDQVQQLGTLVALVFVHLRFANKAPVASELAHVIVFFGAAGTIVPALISIAATDVRAFMRATSSLHAGMLFCGVGTAGHGHYGAALLEAVTFALALGGIGIAVSALEERCGRIDYAGLGGRVRALPRLCLAFGLFGAAGVGLPGTAGFIADDLLLHALWEESAAPSVVIIVGTAILAIGTLHAWSKAFLGPPQPSLAPDLSMRERVALLALALALVALGLGPQAFMTPMAAVL